MTYETRPGTALVVDDDRGMRAVLRNLLEMEGWTVVEAEDGAEALEAYEKYEPDLILTDLRMPGMQGEELARQLREGYAEEGPIVAITRHTPPGPSRELFDAVLTKPVPLRELRNWLNNGAAGDGSAPDGTPGEAGPNSRGGAD